MVHTDLLIFKNYLYGVSPMDKNANSSYADENNNASTQISLPSAPAPQWAVSNKKLERSYTTDRRVTRRPDWLVNMAVRGEGTSHGRENMITRWQDKGDDSPIMPQIQENIYYKLRDIGASENDAYRQSIAMANNPGLQNLVSEAIIQHGFRDGKPALGLANDAIKQIERGLTTQAMYSSVSNTVSTLSEMIKGDHDWGEIKQSGVWESFKFIIAGLLSKIGLNFNKDLGVGNYFANSVNLPADAWHTNPTRTMQA